VDLDAATPDEKGEVVAAALGFSFFGFFFSRLPLCSRLAVTSVAESKNLFPFGSRLAKLKKNIGLGAGWTALGGAALPLVVEN
jgi:hypothetical protein